MKINPVDPMKPIDQTQRASAAQIRPAAPNAAEDEVVISGGAKAIEKAVQAAASADADRTEKVEALRQSVRDGTYAVDAGKVADRIADTAIGSRG